VHEANLLAELAGGGTCSLTGLLDPENMHAGDPLMDFVRLVGVLGDVQVLLDGPAGIGQEGPLGAH
jgi:aminoglycoside phosphotransferase (APT) family kinase protein